jgi:AcrR family transcriptional regulator
MVKATQNVEERKKDIMEAALHCFLNFGYSKTSMDDVAKKAGISRPLIYLKFKNKEDLLLGLFDYIMDGRLEEAEKLIDADLTTKEKLTRMFEIVKIEPWGKISGCPMSQEFFETCHNFDEKAFEKFEKQKHSIVSRILGDKQTAEVFIMSFDGLLEDHPSCAVLKKRMEILIDKFSR